MSKRADHIWMDGSMRRWEDATVHVMSHALHYGSSVFEGIRVYDTPNGPAIFRLEDHIKRLFKSARMYRISWPYTVEELMEACRETVRVNNIKSGYIRPLAFRGAGRGRRKPVPDRGGYNLYTARFGIDPQGHHAAFRRAIAGGYGAYRQRAAAGAGSALYRR